MKNIIISIGLMLGLSLSAMADIGATSYATTGVAYSGKTNYAIIANRSVTGGQPIVVSLNATSDALSTGVGVCQFYRSTNEWSAAAGYTNSTTNIYLTVNNGTGVGSTNGITSSSWVVIEHMNPLSWEAVLLSSVQTNAATNIVTTPSGIATNYVVTIGCAATPTNAVVPSDNVYLQTTNGAGYIPVGPAVNTSGPATVNLYGGQIWVGQRQKPLLLIIGGGTNATINAVSAQYTNP